MLNCQSLDKEKNPLSKDSNGVSEIFAYLIKLFFCNKFKAMEYATYDPRVAF